MTTTKRVGAMLVLASLAFVLSARLVTEGSTVAGREVRATVPYGRDGGERLSAERAPTTIPSTGGAVVGGREEMHGAGSPAAPRTIQVARGSPITLVRDAQDVELAIVEAAREFQVDAALLLCVARAESGFRTDLLGRAGERGPMQFLPRTWGYFERAPDATAHWTGNSAALGYGEQDVWLPIPAARVAASMMSHGQGWQWSTWKGCAG